MPIAANIDQAIAFAPTDIAQVSYQAVQSLLTQMNAWLAGIFSEPTGVFPPSNNETQAGQQRVTNWLFTNLQARDAIESPAPGGSGLVSTTACINAVVRTLSAVKYATIDGATTVAQENAVVAVYNLVWA